MALSQNRACWRASQELRQSRPVSNVPLRGTHGPKTVVHMSNAGFNVLQRAVFVDRLQEQSVVSNVDAAIDAALVYLERQGVLPCARTRAQCVTDNYNLVELLSTPRDESVEYAHPLSFDMSTLDLDKLLTHLRLWAYCFGPDEVYQVGVITEVLGSHVLQLFNAEPEKLPTRTIFLVRRCIPLQATSIYSQVWTALTPSSQYETTAPVAAPQADPLLIDFTMDSTVRTIHHNSVPAPVPASLPRRKSRQNLPSHPHHHSATPYMDRTPAEILAAGSGVDSEEVHGRLILVIALDYRNCQIRDLLNEKRVQEEGRETFKKGSNVVLQRIKHALQHSFGHGNYNANFASYKAARDGDAAARARWLTALTTAAPRAWHIAASCALCNKGTNHTPKHSAESPDDTPDPAVPGDAQPAADELGGAMYIAATTAPDPQSPSMAKCKRKRSRHDSVVGEESGKRAKCTHPVPSNITPTIPQPASAFADTYESQDAINSTAGSLPPDRSDQGNAALTHSQPRDYAMQSDLAHNVDTEQGASALSDELNTTAAADHHDEWACIFCSGTLYHHQAGCVMQFDLDESEN
ncbi:hypothetical protein Slin15195_G066170 [Septoria linicola]|uniref:Uncharacterized protein n=1 Tax=Septoria linicola TaxID=215465 RepID=A0A9Q9ELC2_9PEZI|nr:hypothetical protein Slin15195_G066170 [Septoria linicola]